MQVRGSSVSLVCQNPDLLRDLSLREAGAQRPSPCASRAGGPEGRIVPGGHLALTCADLSQDALQGAAVVAVGVSGLVVAMSLLALHQERPRHGEGPEAGRPPLSLLPPVFGPLRLNSRSSLCAATSSKALQRPRSRCQGPRRRGKEPLVTDLGGGKAEGRSAGPGSRPTIHQVAFTQVAPARRERGCNRLALSQPLSLLPSVWLARPFGRWAVWGWR